MIVTVIRVIVCFMCFAAAMLFLVILDIAHKERERKERMERQARAAKLAQGEPCPLAHGRVDNKCQLCRYYGGHPHAFAVLCNGVNRRAKE